MDMAVTLKPGVTYWSQVSGDDELPDRWPDIDVHDQRHVTKVPSSDVTMNDKFEEAQTGTGSVYPLCGETPGHCLLIDNESFKEARSSLPAVNLTDRTGTRKDSLALDKVFTQLGYDVELHSNLSAQGMLEAVQNKARENHTGYSSFVCAVLSHGEQDHVYGTDGQLLPLKKLYEAVNDYNCPTLKGKPRLFFIQACQGNKQLSRDVWAAGGESSQQETTEDEHEVMKGCMGVNIRDDTEHDAHGFRVASQADVFVAMATMPGYVSWRNIECGSWFIQAIVYVFTHLAHKYELRELMAKVIRLVSKAETRTGKKQVSMCDSALTSEFYFFPGLLHEGVVPSNSNPP